MSPPPMYGVTSVEPNMQFESSEFQWQLALGSAHLAQSAQPSEAVAAMAKSVPMLLIIADIASIEPNT